MKIFNDELKKRAAKNNNQHAYEAPAVIYEGTITTRAGSPAGEGEEGIDPADLFGTND